VDLPEPLGPMMQAKRPLSMANETLRSTGSLRPPVV
jgi:hypothetical protein